MIFIKNDNKILDILDKLNKNKKISKEERKVYHKYKRDTSYTMLATRPDKSENDVRVSAIYHNNCLEKAKGNKKFFKSNKKLYDMALNYAVKYKDVPLGDVPKKKNEYRI